MDAGDNYRRLDYVPPWRRPSSSTMWSANTAPPSRTDFRHLPAPPYEVDSDPAVTNIQVDFTAGMGLTSSACAGRDGHALAHGPADGVRDRFDRLGLDL